VLRTPQPAAFVVRSFATAEPRGETVKVTSALNKDEVEQRCLEVCLISSVTARTIRCSILSDEQVVRNFEKITDKSKVTANSHFVKDLGLDSLDEVEVGEYYCADTRHHLFSVAYRR
jgi:hypothetical protein